MSIYVVNNFWEDPVVDLRTLRGENDNILTSGYAILHKGKAIECLTCGMVSYNVNDILNKFCGWCDKFLEGA